MHSQDDHESRIKNVTTVEPVGQLWPFLIQGVMENPSCLSTPQNTILALLWTAVAVFGIVYALLGYRCLRAVGFLTGLAAGMGCFFWLQSQSITVVGHHADSALAIITGLFGAILGSTHPIATALVSLFAGALTSGSIIVICIATLPHYLFGQNEVVVAVVGGAIIFGVLTVLSAKLITIISSSIIGSTMIIASMDFFMHGSDTLFWFLHMKPNPEPPPCWGGLLICSWPLAILISIFVQCFITAWRIDHQRPPRRRRHAHRTNSTRPRETREEARQRKYRYLYQVRTARGDIISQNYVSALQKRVQPGRGPPSEHSTKSSLNERNTLNSDRTHFTNIPDSDTDKIDFAHERA